MAKRRYSKEFRQFAVERPRGCENIVALANELHVSRRQLYRWRDQLDPEIAGMETPGHAAQRGEPLEASYPLLNLRAVCVPLALPYIY